MKCLRAKCPECGDEAEVSPTDEPTKLMMNCRCGFTVELTVDDTTALEVMAELGDNAEPQGEPPPT